MFRKLLDQGRRATPWDVCCAASTKEEISRARSSPSPAASRRTRSSSGSLHTQEGRGGRHSHVFTNYRPQFYLRTTDVTGSVNLPEDVKMVMPGDTITMSIELVSPVALEEQMRFAIRRRGRTVGAGVVTKILA